MPCGCRRSRVTPHAATRSGSSSTSAPSAWRLPGARPTSSATSLPSGALVCRAAVIAEVLGHAGCPGPFLGHTLATLAVEHGNPAQQARWLPRLATGEAIGTVAFCEGAGAWQPEQWMLPLGDRLSGRKCHVLQA